MFPVFPIWSLTVNYSATATIDYLAFTVSGHVVFQPITPRAYEAFKGLPMDSEGCFSAYDDADANALFERLDYAGLCDLTIP